MTGSFDAKPFDGAKVAILSNARVVTLLRDETPGLAWPGCWDLPGGGREGREAPEHTVVRETEEETGLRLSPERFAWRQSYLREGRRSWFFVALWPELTETDLRLGSEGTAIRLMPVMEFRSRGDTVMHLVARLGDWLAG